MQILYALGALFFLIWLAGMVLHGVAMLLGLLFHYALWIAIILIVIAYIRGRSAR